MLFKTLGGTKRLLLVFSAKHESNDHKEDK